jgi:hypothetical protein
VAKERRGPTGYLLTEHRADRVILLVNNRGGMAITIEEAEDLILDLQTAIETARTQASLAEDTQRIPVSEIQRELDQAVAAEKHLWSEDHGEERAG